MNIVLLGVFHTRYVHFYDLLQMNSFLCVAMAFVCDPSNCDTMTSTTTTTHQSLIFTPSSVIFSILLRNIWCASRGMQKKGFPYPYTHLNFRTCLSNERRQTHSIVYHHPIRFERCVIWCVVMAKQRTSSNGTQIRTCAECNILSCIAFES